MQCELGKYRPLQTDVAPITVDFASFVKPAGSGCTYAIPDNTQFAGFRWRNFMLETCQGSAYVFVSGGGPANFSVLKSQLHSTRIAMHGVSV